MVGLNESDRYVRFGWKTDIAAQCPRNVAGLQVSAPVARDQRASPLEDAVNSLN